LEDWFEGAIKKELILGCSMDKTEKDIRNILDNLFKNAKTIEDIIQIPFSIDEYIEDGYNVKDYIHKYNLLVQEFYSK